MQVALTRARGESGEQRLARVHRVVFGNPLPRGTDIRRCAPDLLERLQITGADPSIVQHMHHVGLTVNAVGREVGAAAEHGFRLTQTRGIEPAQDDELVMENTVGDAPALVCRRDLFQAGLVKGGGVFARLRVIQNANVHPAPRAAFTASTITGNWYS